MDKPSKRRSSILKRIDNSNLPSSPTFTRRISFHGKKSVKEFSEGTDKATIWHHSYEEEAAHHSNEPLPGSSAVFQKSAFATSHMDPAASEATLTTHSAIRPVCADDSSNGHEMSLTYIDHGVPSQLGQSKAHLLNGFESTDDDDRLQYDDVASFNHSLDQMSFDNESLDDSETKPATSSKPNMNRTKFETLPLDENSDQMSYDLSGAPETGRNSVVVFSSLPSGNQTHYNGDAMDMTGVVRKSLRIHQKTIAHEQTMDITAAFGNRTAPVVQKPQNRIATGVNDESAMNFTRIPVVVAEPAYNESDMDLDGGSKVPESLKLPTMPVTLQANNDTDMDLDCGSKVQSSSRPANRQVSVLRQMFTRRNKTIYNDADMDKTNVQPRVVLSPADVESEMELSDQMATQSVTTQRTHRNQTIYNEADMDKTNMKSRMPSPADFDSEMEMSDPMAAQGRTAQRNQTIYNDADMDKTDVKSRMPSPADFGSEMEMSDQVVAQGRIAQRTQRNQTIYNEADMEKTNVQPRVVQLHTDFDSEMDMSDQVVAQGRTAQRTQRNQTIYNEADMEKTNVQPRVVQLHTDFDSEMDMSDQVVAQGRTAQRTQRNQTIYNEADMEKTNVQPRVVQLHTDFDSEMEMSDQVVAHSRAAQRTQHMAHDSMDITNATSHRSPIISRVPLDNATNRRSIMELTHGTPTGNFSIYIDETMVMPRDLLSSTKIADGAAIDWTNESSYSGEPMGEFKSEPLSRRSVIQCPTTADERADRCPEACESVAREQDAMTCVPADQLDTDRQRFDRTLQAIGADGLECISGVSLLSADGADSKIPSILHTDASSSMRLFRTTELTGATDDTGTSNTTDDLCHMNAEQICGARKREPSLGRAATVRATLAAASDDRPATPSLHFSHLNNHADLTTFGRNSDTDDTRRTPSPAIARITDGMRASLMRNSKRCSIGTADESEDSLCKLCTGCQRKQQQQQNPGQRRSGVRRRSELRSLSPLGPMTSLLVAGDVAADGVAGGGPLHVDYGGYAQLAQYASVDEVFVNFRQRMERLEKEQSEERMRISSNVPSPGWVCLMNNMLDAEFAQIESERRRLAEERGTKAPLPVRRTIESLLRNVFDTQSLPWHYDDTLYQRGRISLWHESISSLILRLHFEMPTTNDVDLRFSRIKFQVCSQTAKCMHPLMWVRHNELLATLPFELTSLCPTSAHLMTFLQRLDEQHFRPAVQIARSIGRIAAGNDALVSRESDGTCFVERQVFDQQSMQRTTLTIKLTVVAQTTLQHVYLKPARTIRAEASAPTALGVGLACIESLLHDPWLYIERDNADQGGTKRTSINKMC